MSIIKNEAEYIGYSIMSVLDYVDELVYFDGNSTDGTIEIIEYIQKKYDKDKKIKLFKNKDFSNFKEDYVRLNNDCLKACSGDYIWFLHPDMTCLNPEVIKQNICGKYIRYNVKVDSIGGEKRDKLFTKGRLFRWQTIYKNDFGLHYYGYYGTPEEDFYFKDITGDDHSIYDFSNPKPYTIKDTNIKINHYCETKPYDRRLDKMIKVFGISNPQLTQEEVLEHIKEHPRVTLKGGIFRGVKFEVIDNPKQADIFEKYKEFEQFRVK